MTDIDDDIQHLREAIRHRPHEVAHHIWLLAALARRDGLEANGEAAFRKMYEMRPEWTQLHNDVIEYWCDHHRNTYAVLDLFESAHRQKPRDLVIGYAYGLALQAAGRVEDAVALYRDLLRIQPSFAAGHHNLAIAYRFLDRRKEAEASALEAIRLAPTMAEPHFVLGGYYSLVGSRDKAMYHTRRFLELAHPYLEKYTATAEMSLAFSRQAAGEGPFTRFLKKWRARWFTRGRT